MDAAVRIAAAGLCAALLYALLKKSNGELALVLALAGAAVVLYMAAGLLSSAAETARRAHELSGLTGAVFTPLVKCVAVGIICSLAAETCRDSGSSQLAAAVELAGAAAALFCALPLVSSLLDTVEALL